MAHFQQMMFIKALSELLPEYFHGTRVLEIGSLNVNGSVRIFFSDCEYIGYDVSEGSGVDIVKQGQLIDEPTGSRDVVISAECFEHNPFWAETFSNMLRICRAGGLVAVTCATSGRPEHGTARAIAQDSPLTVRLGWEYYRNLTTEDFMAACNLRGWLQAFHFYVCPSSFDLYLFGIRKGDAWLGAQEKVTALDRILLQRVGAYKVAGHFD